MKRLIPVLLASLMLVGCQPSRLGFRFLSWMGAEVPGLNMSLKDIPGQTTVDGRPQVLVYGPRNCAPTQRTVEALAQTNIPYVYKNTDDRTAVTQDELGALILSLPKDSKGSPFVLIQGELLTRPTLEEITARYNEIAQ